MVPSDGAEPPDGSSNKTYKCCNKTNVGHFKPINGAKRISDTFIICDQHTNLDLTSKFDHVLVTTEVRTIIAKIKLEVRNLVKQDLLEEIHEETQKALNKTIVDKNDGMEEHLLIETTLLKKLNEEIIDNNFILKQLNEELTNKNNLFIQKLNKNGNNLQIPNRTYAQILTNAKPKPKRVPKIVIKKRKKKKKWKIWSMPLLAV